MSISNQDGKLEELYNNFLKFADIMVEDYDPLAVAGVMTAISLSIYRTSLNDNDYERMVVSIFDKRQDVKRFSSGLDIE